MAKPDSTLEVAVVGAGAAGLGAAKALARPLDGRFHFAGEATSDAFFSTAHGAYLSGIAAAEAVAALCRG